MNQFDSDTAERMMEHMSHSTELDNHITICYDGYDLGGQVNLVIPESMVGQLPPDLLYAGERSGKYIIYKTRWDEIFRMSLIGGGIIGKIHQERTLQDDQWGGPEHDDEHQPSDWIAFMGKFMRRIQNGECVEDSLVKIAALAIAALQSNKRKSR